MADEEQLRILRQGAEAWNEWRQQAPGTRVDLRDADLRGVDLRGADLSQADFSFADLSQANLSQANLNTANLMAASLFGADLSEADLTQTNLSMADLAETDFRATVFFNTILANVGLSDCKNLDAILHFGRSSIDMSTLQWSDCLPLVFLRGVGLPDKLIEYLPSLLGQAIQHYSCFISYSSKDDAFAHRLHADLQDKGVRCWSAPEDMKIGAKICDTIDEAIRLRDKVLLVLSEASIASDWVEDEVDKAFEEERGWQVCQKSWSKSSTRRRTREGAIAQSASCEGRWRCCCSAIRPHRHPAGNEVVRRRRLLGRRSAELAADAAQDLFHGLVAQVGIRSRSERRLKGWPDAVQ